MFERCTRLLRRRWVTGLVGVVGTVFIAGYVAQQVQPEYQATSQVLFLLPPQAVDPEDPPVNPYLNLPEGLGTTANLIAGMVTTDDSQRQLAERGFDAEFTVALVAGAGPVLEITTRGDDQAAALKTRDAVMKMINEDLDRIQGEAQVPANTVISTAAPTVSSKAEPLRGRVYKAVAGVAVVFLLLSFLACLLTDLLLSALSVRRTRRRVGDQPGAAAEAAEVVLSSYPDEEQVATEDVSAADRGSHVVAEDSSSSTRGEPHDTAPAVRRRPGTKAISSPKGADIGGDVTPPAQEEDVDPSAVQDTPRVTPVRPSRRQRTRPRRPGTTPIADGDATAGNAPRSLAG